MNKEKIKLSDKELQKCLDELQGTNFLNAFCVLDWILKTREEIKELHNKIDEISEFIKENKIKRYRPIEGEEYDEEILLDLDDITCLERIINDEYDYENR